ncbi:MAG: serine/threonine-protein kinase [Pseudomonadota bacterium]|nr:serine/threonine-protein kinase [Pseudomonadota bacterium]
MDTERWRKLSPLLDAMLELDPATRARSMASLREEDPELGNELAALMALEDDHADFLTEPLVAPLPGPRPGTLAGPYRLERLLGEGGMGQVWLAGRADGLYQRRVALKLLRPGLADPNLHLRFTRERQILARLAHPHIARLLDAGISSDGQPYLALEYVEGEPIDEWCGQRELSLDARLRLFLQTCDAVSHAHANLIVHRDLKPSNILVTPQEEVRLLDFGIAKLLDTTELAPEQTGTGLRTFTLHYAAPEQIRGEPVTTMTDVYALGVVLHQLLTGQRPYQLKRSTDAEWEEAILGADPVRPSQAMQRTDQRRMARVLAGDLDNIVLKALAKRPEQRYPSVEALAQDIARYRDGKPVKARPQSVRYRLGKFIGRHRWSLATGALVAMVLSTSFVMVAWQAREAVREASRAQALQNFVIGLFEGAGGDDGARPLDVRALLDAGLQRGDRELAHQPIARAELMGVVARLRLGMGDYLPALDLLGQQAALIASLGDEAPDSLRLESATELGRTHLALGSDAACIADMGGNVGLAQREQSQLPVQVSAFWSQLARCRRAGGAPDIARPLFQRALALRRDVLDDGPGVVQDLAGLAGLEADHGDFAKALGGYRDALRRLNTSSGPHHPYTVTLLRDMCVLQRRMGDTIGAERDCGNALELAHSLHGESHPATIAALRAMAIMQVQIGRFEEAAQALAITREWTASHAGIDHVDVADDDDGLARIHWERGEMDAALATLDRAARQLRDSGKAPRLLADVLVHKAMVLHELGRDAEARPLLEQSRRRIVDTFGAGHPGVGETDRLLGEVDAALGDRERAGTELAAAVRIIGNALGDTHAAARKAQLSLARFQAAQGDQAALARLDALAAHRAPRELGLQKVAWQASAAAAGLRCRGSQRNHALAALQAVAAEVRNAQPEGGAIAREIETIRRRCL